MIYNFVFRLRKIQFMEETTNKRLLYNIYKMVSTYLLFRYILHFLILYSCHNYNYIVSSILYFILLL